MTITVKFSSLIVDEIIKTIVAYQCLLVDFL